MQAPLLHKIHEQNLWLSGHRAVFWEDTSTLIVSDCHFGKTGHFRKSGIAVPQQVYKEDLQRLLHLILYFKPKQLIVVGDLFHSKSNLELNWFTKWRNDLTSLSIILVKGNHDILQKSWYQSAGIELVKDSLKINSFRFSHEYCEVEENEYTFCGHLHPGIVLNGMGKQSLRFPCFYFAAAHCILPAFGRFTGLANINPQPGEKVYAVVSDDLIPLR